MSAAKQGSSARQTKVFWTVHNRTVIDEKQKSERRRADRIAEDLPEYSNLSEYAPGRTRVEDILE